MDNRKQNLHQQYLMSNVYWILVCIFVISFSTNEKAQKWITKKYSYKKSFKVFINKKRKKKKENNKKEQKNLVIKIKS